MDLDSLVINEFTEILSPDELQRAGRFRINKDRDRFIVARGTLRRILSRYLAIKPERITFFYNSFGKPFLKTEDYSLRFNVSHSRGRALFAIAHNQEVGIDIEAIDERVEILKTARRVFSPVEVYNLEALPVHLQTDAFFRGWTRKEALLKAFGEGFALKKDLASFSDLSGKSTMAINTHEVRDICDWTVMSLPSRFGFKSALAAKGSVRTIRIRHWQGN